MSTQLIVFPQNHNGQYNSVSNATATVTQYVTNGINFTGFSTTPLHNTFDNDPVADSIVNAHPFIVGAWYRFTTILGGVWGAVTAPALAINSIHLSHNGTTEGHTGVYQKLSNLTVGSNYNLKVTLQTAQTGLINFSVFDFTTITHSDLQSTTSTTVATTFTATTPDDIIVIDYMSVDADIYIDTISIAEINTTLDYSDLDNGQVICDLYQEEDIPLTLSIDDFTNVAEKMQSFSKGFSLPATKRNNRIFNNMFEVTRADDGIIFNPYVKTQAILKQDGFILFEGFLRMIDIKEKNGEISYNVNLYSEVIALADVLKEQTFSNLNFSELDHVYNKQNIKDSWNNGIGLLIENAIGGSSFAYDGNLPNPQFHTNVLKYPFVDWNHQYLVGGTTGNNSVAGFPELTSLQQTFRPFIQLKYLINKIFQAANFTFTSAFFDTAEFENLFMDFNWGDDVTPSSTPSSGTGSYKADDTLSALTTGFSRYVIPTNTYAAEFGFDTPTANVFTCPTGQANTQINMSYNCRFRCASITATSEDMDVKWVKTTAAGTVTDIDVVTGQTVLSSASAIVTTDSTFSLSNFIDSIAMVDLGFYAIAPTVTIVGEGIFGSGATATCTIDGSGQVDSITVTNVGSGYVFGATVIFDNVTPLWSYVGSFTVTLGVGDTLEMQMKAGTTGVIRQDSKLRNNTTGVGSAYPITGNWTASITSASILDSTLLNTLRGELGQWDFLKGIMTMFNLITMVDESNPNNILIEPYGDVFINNTAGTTLASRSIEHDWTDKIDAAQMDLNPLTDLNKYTTFKFAEDEDDYCFQVYKNSTSGHLYGSKRIDASGLSLLQGEKEIVADPFAATVSKPLMPQFPDFIVPSLYAVSDDGECEGFENSPRILYNNGQKNTGISYYIPAQSALSSENQSFFLQFSHLSAIPSNSTLHTDFLFESQQLISGVGDPPVNNLFRTYWSPYFDELYSPDTRVMKLRVNLSPAEISTFKFYDTVMIKNRSFRVNKIEYKPNTLAKVEFILIP